LHLTQALNTNPRFPILAHDDQDLLFASAFGVLNEGISTRAFPCASVAITHKGKLVALKAVGRFTYDPESAPVNSDTMFDLASVSKVVATTTMAMILYERGELDLETPVVSLVPEFASSDDRRHEVTLHMLLAHSSGLPAYVKLFEQASTAGQLLLAACRVPLAADPGTRAEYSDIGFIVLGEALTRLAGERLDHFCQHQIFAPLGMVRTTFNPPIAVRADVPPTADDKTFRHRVIQGEVHDENASVLGGVGGHAGVFATAGHVATFAHCMLTGGAPIVHPETIARFTRRETNPPGTSRALGWDTPSQPSQSGQYFSASSYGHLGYTGTSLWIDPERQLSVTLLTNRTWPDNRNQSIKRIRPLFHDTVVQCLETHT